MEKRPTKYNIINKDVEKRGLIKERETDQGKRSIYLVVSQYHFVY